MTKPSQSSINPTIHVSSTLSPSGDRLPSVGSAQLVLAALVAVVLFSTAGFSQASTNLISVAAITPSDAWVVGYRNAINRNGRFLYDPLARHWDGTKWAVSDVSLPAGHCSTLSAVAAVASNDVWAVGGPNFNCENRGDIAALIEHWDGSEWLTVSSPTPANKVLTGVAAIASNDVWAVGYFGTVLTTYTLAEHWDGSQWNVIPSPNEKGQKTYFNAVTAIAPNDVWAVGAYLKPPRNLWAPLAEHWDGVSWKIVQIPVIGNNFSILYGVASAGGDEVWAVGDSDTLILWDGAKWNSVQYSNSENLFGVFSFPNGEAWTVGNQDLGHGFFSTYTEQWDGSAWNVVPSPNLPFTDGLGSVSGTGPTDVWAVGGYALQSGITGGFLEHWDGAVWTIVPSP